MQDDPRYDNVLLDVYDALEARIGACEKAGISRERIIVDPGIGFGKTSDHNLALLGGLGIFHGLGTPITLGASRKSFIGTLTGAIDPAERLPGSLAAAMVAILQGVQILRVHDVAATRQALIVYEAALTGTPPAAL
jgi:dihydropteroate synthase